MGNFLTVSARIFSFNPVLGIEDFVGVLPYHPETDLTDYHLSASLGEEVAGQSRLHCLRLKGIDIHRRRLNQGNVPGGEGNSDMNLNMGICLGATTISVAERAASGLRYHRLAHDGRVAVTLQQILKDQSPARLGITGRKFRHLVALPTVTEPEAVEMAYAHLRESWPGIEAIVSAGGETFLLYLLDTRGRICGVHSGNKCAAGTGEFFLQQIRRMELDIDQAGRGQHHHQGGADSHRHPGDRRRNLSANRW
jgi:hypothetical protein